MAYWMDVKNIAEYKEKSEIQENKNFLCSGSCSPGLLLETIGPLFFHTMKKGSKTNTAIHSQKQNPVLTNDIIILRKSDYIMNEIFGTVLMSKYGCLVTLRWLNSFSGNKIIICIINKHVLHI